MNLDLKTVDLLCLAVSQVDTMAYVIIVSIDNFKTLHLESTFMGALEVRTTETMTKPIVVVIMLERTEDEIGSFQVHSLHVHKFKEHF